MCPQWTLDSTSLPLPMSEVELALKQNMQKYPQLTDHILTSDELSSYLHWLIETFGKEGKKESSLRLLNNSDVHRETSYLLDNHDIAVGRMLRYMPAHWHTNDFFELYYVSSGTCPICFSEETIFLKPGSVLILAPGVLHASPCYSDDADLSYFMVRSTTFEKVFWNQLPPENLMTFFFRQALSMPKGTSYLHFETGEDQDIRSLLARVEGEYHQNEIYGAQMMNALLSEFFVLLLRKYEGTARLPRTEDFHWKHEFSAIFCYLQAHYPTATQKEVADNFHYSPRQLTRIIQNCTGMNFAQLVTKLKMEQAALLLLEGRPLEIIAARTGYSGVSSFYRAFEAYYGCTPKQFQKSKDASIRRGWN